MVDSDPTTPSSSAQVDKRAQRKPASPRLEYLTLLAGVPTATGSRVPNSLATATPQLRESILDSAQNGVCRTLAKRGLALLIDTIPNYKRY